MSIRRFLQGLPLLFQRNQSAGLDVTYHFTYTGEETCKATVGIRSYILTVQDGHLGIPQLQIRAGRSLQARRSHLGAPEPCAGSTHHVAKN
jgi:hypothetical protein